MAPRKYQDCTRCVLDSNDSSVITFDEQGVCSLCRIYDDAVKKSVFRGKEGEEKLKALVQEVKNAGVNNQYDCIIGLSGGVDSTYVAWKVKEMGLRPLAVHLDNGWDSELAVKNIENIVRKLGIDLHTHVINWNEFRDLQLAYFKAGVIDLEIPTDHAIMAVLYHEARKNKIKYILSGHNLVTEGFLPDDWIHHKFDVLNLKAIHKRFGSAKLKTYPLLPFFEKFYYEKILRLKQISVLNYLPYEKNEAKQLIMEKLNWRDYGGKHYESIFTRFYQAYILPRKFHVDKRKSHFSTLICSGQLTREAALEMLKHDPYPAEEMMNADRAYVIKKLGFTEAEFEAYMKAPVKKHNDYPSYMNIYFKLRPLIRIYRKVFPRK